MRGFVAAGLPGFLDGMQVVWGSDRSCRARPAGRSLVAEDRSAGGIRDQRGPEP